MLDMFIASVIGLVKARAVVLRGLSIASSSRLGIWCAWSAAATRPPPENVAKVAQHRIVDHTDEKPRVEWSGNLLGEEGTDRSSSRIDSSEELTLVPSERLSVIPVSRSRRPLRCLRGKDLTE